MQTNTQIKWADGRNLLSRPPAVVVLTLVSVFSWHMVASQLYGSDALVYMGPSIKAETAAEDGSQVPETNVAVNEAPKLGAESRFVGIERQDTLWNPLTKSWLTSEQMSLLKLSYEVGFQHGGSKQARLMQSTLMQETIAGLMGRIGHMSAPVGKRSYGVMQVKVSAARDVLGRHDELGSFRSDEELIAKLLTDDHFNIRLASLHMMHLRKYTDNDAQALMAYNIGLRGSRRHSDHGKFRYVKGVRRHYENVVAPFNEKFLAQTVTASNA